MAAFQGNLSTSEIALIATTPKTVLQLIAASNHRVKILGWGVYFDGTSASSSPVVVDLVRQTTAGTMSALTAKKRDDSIAETLQTTGQYNATVEPSDGDILESKEVHPQSGYEKIYPFGQEIIVGGGDRIAIKCTAPDNVNVIVDMSFEE